MKITIEEFVKRVNALKTGEHISVKLVENGYIVTAFATEVKGNRYHFLMVEGFYGNCEQGFEGFDEQGAHEYIDYVKNLDSETQELDEITELIVVEEKKNDMIQNYELLMNRRKQIQEETKKFLDKVLEERGDRFDLKCKDYDSWDDAFEREESFIANQLPYSVSCQGWSGDTFEVYLTSVRLVKGHHTAYVTGYSLEEGCGWVENEKCYLYTGNLEAVANFVHLVIKEG